MVYRGVEALNRNQVGLLRFKSERGYNQMGFLCDLLTTHRVNHRANNGCNQKTRRVFFPCVIVLYSMGAVDANFEVGE